MGWSLFTGPQGVPGRKRSDGPVDLGKTYRRYEDWTQNPKTHRHLGRYLNTEIMTGAPHHRLSVPRDGTTSNYVSTRNILNRGPSTYTPRGTDLGNSPFDLFPTKGARNYQDGRMLCVPLISNGDA